MLAHFQDLWRWRHRSSSSSSSGSSSRRKFSTNFLTKVVAAAVCIAVHVVFSAADAAAAEQVHQNIVESTVESGNSRSSASSAGAGAGDDSGSGSSAVPSVGNVQEGRGFGMKTLGHGACRGRDGVDDFHSFDMKPDVSSKQCRDLCLSNPSCSAADLDANGKCFLFDSHIVQAMPRICKQPCTCWVKRDPSSSDDSTSSTPSSTNVEATIERVTCTSLDGPYCMHVNKMERPVVEVSTRPTIAATKGRSPRADGSRTDSAADAGDLVAQLFQEILDIPSDSSSTWESDLFGKPITSGGTFSVAGSWQTKPTTASGKPSRQTSLELRAGAWLDTIPPPGWITAGFRATVGAQDPNEMEIELIDEQQTPWGVPLEHCTTGVLYRQTPSGETPNTLTQSQHIRLSDVFGTWKGSYECNGNTINAEIILVDPEDLDMHGDEEQERPISGLVEGTVHVESTRVRSGVELGAVRLQRLLNGV